MTFDPALILRGFLNGHEGRLVGELVRKKVLWSGGLVKALGRRLQQFLLAMGAFRVARLLAAMGYLGIALKHLGLFKVEELGACKRRENGQPFFHNPPFSFYCSRSILCFKNPAWLFSWLAFSKLRSYTLRKTIRSKETHKVKTRITELLGIEHPIVCGGMMHVGRVELAAAISNAGALGNLTALNSGSPENLAKDIARLRDLTDKPFAVNLTILPSIKPVPYEEYVNVICEMGVKIVETAGRNPEPYMPAFNAAEIKVIHKCTSVRHALKAEKLGAAAASVDGFECAGHPGEDDIPNLVLLPAAAAKLNIPMIASGGIGTGAQMAACFALGAEGINMGTRFMCTQEAAVHDNIKEKIVASSELDTSLIFRTLRNTARVHKNAVSEEVVAIEAKPGPTDFKDLKDLVVGTKGRLAMDEGQLDAGIWSSGMVQGLIDDIPSCQELVKTTVADCEEVISKRLTAMLC